MQPAALLQVCNIDSVPLLLTGSGIFKVFFLLVVVDLMENSALFTKGKIDIVLISATFILNIYLMFWNKQNI